LFKCHCASKSREQERTDKERRSRVGKSLLPNPFARNAEVSREFGSLKKALGKIWTGKKKVADVLRAHALRPVLETLATELRDVCTDDCRRISTDPMKLSKDDIDGYWLRLRTPLKTLEENKRERLIVMVEKHDETCKVGFKLDKKVGCPIVRVEHKDDTPPDIDKTLETLSTIVQKPPVSS